MFTSETTVVVSVARENWFQHVLADLGVVGENPLGSLDPCGK